MVGLRSPECIMMYSSPFSKGANCLNKKTNKVPQQDTKYRAALSNKLKNVNVIISGGKNMSDDLERFIEKKKAESPEFADNFEEGYLNFKIGVILRQTREDMGITQQEVADKLNTTKSVISRMENHADDIRLSTLRKYARALGRSVKLEIQ